MGGVAGAARFLPHGGFRKLSTMPPPGQSDDVSRLSKKGDFVAGWGFPRHPLPLNGIQNFKDL